MRYRRVNIAASPPDGQISSDCPKWCQVQKSKIFRFVRDPNQSFNAARLPRQEGRSRSSRSCGGMRWTRRLRLTSVATSVRRNRLGPTPRCWRQVHEELTLLADDGGKKAGHQDEIV